VALDLYFPEEDREMPDGRQQNFSVSFEFDARDFTEEEQEAFADEVHKRLTVLEGDDFGLVCSFGPGVVGLRVMVPAHSARDAVEKADQYLWLIVWPRLSEPGATEAILRRCEAVREDMFDADLQELLEAAIAYEDDEEGTAPA
jgi:hypothetical protein